MGECQHEPIYQKIRRTPGRGLKLGEGPGGMGGPAGCRVHALVVPSAHTTSSHPPRPLYYNAPSLARQGATLCRIERPCFERRLVVGYSNRADCPPEFFDNQEMQP